MHHNNSPSPRGFLVSYSWSFRHSLVLCYWYLGFNDNGGVMMVCWDNHFGICKFLFYMQSGNKRSDQLDWGLALLQASHLSISHCLEQTFASFAWWVTTVSHVESYMIWSLDAMYISHLFVGFFFVCTAFASFSIYCTAFASFSI